MLIVAWRSIALKLIAIIAIFLLVPVMLYTQFQELDAQRKALLLQTIREQGRLVAEGIVPVLQRFKPGSPAAVTKALSRFVKKGESVKVLFRPAAAAGTKSFFYIASAPLVAPEYLELERDELARLGLFESLGKNCEADYQSALLFKNPRGKEELMTSITPKNLESGCWIIISAQSLEDSPVRSALEPLWRSPQVQIAAAIYASMALITVWLVGSVLRNLLRFRRLARDIRTRADSDELFVQQNRIPELAGVAQEFDFLVGSLRETASNIVQAAEENAHALKTPLAVISQSLEPLKKKIAPEDKRGQRAIDLIEKSVERLDALVIAARRMDEASASLMTPPKQQIALSDLLQGLCQEMALVLDENQIKLDFKIEPGLVALGSNELFETVAENLIENAASFSPAGGTVSVRLSRQGRKIELVVEDQGPGVSEALLEQIFDRYYSHRPSGKDTQTAIGETHFGIGLWIVRRNIEGVNGTVYAENRESGGLRVIVRLVA